MGNRGLARLGLVLGLQSLHLGLHETIGLVDAGHGIWQRPFHLVAHKELGDTAEVGNSCGELMPWRCVLVTG